MPEHIRFCEWCSEAYTVIRTGPGRPPLYCSATCKAAAQKALAAGRMKRMRERQAEHHPRLKGKAGRLPNG